ncbi:MAG: CehA/McbA family metallohydrolase [Acidobacteriia bacterium]|nr:CehA/McbA family metallohydrolase [Terriglobia bacterium]
MRIKLVTLFGMLLAYGALRSQAPPASSARIDVSTQLPNGPRMPARIYLFKDNQPFRLQPVQATLPIKSDLFYRDRLWMDGSSPDVLEVICNDEYHYFLLKGAATFHLPPGKYRMEAYRGFFYTPAKQEFEVKADQTLPVSLTLQSWDGANPGDWISADDHIHLTRTPRENSVYSAWLEAEDLNIAHFLALQRKSDAASQYAFGRAGQFQQRGYTIRSGQETRNQRFGHILMLGADKLVRPMSTGAELANTPEDYPFHSLLFDLARSAGALTGYAHFRERPRNTTLYMDLALGKLQFIELFQFGVLTVEPWYELLNAGFKLAPMAGSDFPVYVQRLKPYPRWVPLFGPERAMVKAKAGEDPFAAWAAGVREGRVMVSNGPVVEIEIEAGRVKAKAAFWRPLLELEIIRNGMMVARVNGSGTTKLEAAVPTMEGENAWYAARVQARREEGEPEIQAHTSPVYVGQRAIQKDVRRAIAAAWEAELSRYRQLGLVFARPEHQREFFDAGERALAELRRP